MADFNKTADIAGMGVRRGFPADDVETASTHTF